MKIFGTFLILSVLIVFLSIFLYQSIDRNEYDMEIINGILKTNELLLKLDMYFKSFNFPYFYRGFENLISNIIFYFSKSSDLNIKTDNFDGVEVLLFIPNKQVKQAPAIIFFHGGGWTLCNPKIYSYFLALLSRKLDTMIVAVNYRKAPEHPYPVAFTDAKVATRYFFKNSAKFGIDPARIALMGDSAGGNLVVTVGHYFSTLKKSGKSVDTPKVLIPLNPSLQMADFHMPSYSNEGRDVVTSSRKSLMKLVCFYALGELSMEGLTNCVTTLLANGHLSPAAVKVVKNNMDWSKLLTEYEKHPKSSFSSKRDYLTDRFSELVLDPFFSPLSALNDTDLGQLPPVYLLAYSNDILKDDARLLSARLAKIGKIGVYHEKTCCHSLYFFAFTKIKRAIDAIDDIASIFEKNAIL